MRILIVDDNQDAAESIEDLLLLEGHHTRVVLSGSAALRTYREDAYDLVFLDLKMPDMDGLETARRLLDLNPAARIVVVTGNAVQEDLAQASQMGIAGLLRKPFRAEELMAYLQ